MDELVIRIEVGDVVEDDKRVEKGDPGHEKSPC
jgi:hypothetical protein